MFELRHLRHAISLAEHRNFARAADALHISQSALSRSIQALEEALGVLLFDRSHVGVEPTLMGQLLLKNARDVDLAARDLRREIALAKGLSSGELKIGVGPWGAAMLAGAVVGAMSLQYPQLQLKMVIGPWKELPERLQTREIDLAIIHTSEIQAGDEIEVQPLHDHPTLLVCRANHPLTQQAVVSTKDVFNYPLAAPILPTGTAEKILSHLPADLRAAAVKRGLIQVTCDSSSVLKSVVAHSDALTIMNAFMVLDELRSGKLVAIPGIQMGVGGSFGVVRLKARSLSAAAKRFIELLLEHDQSLAREEVEFFKSELTNIPFQKGEFARNF
ncbi:MAG: LysR family transcriptional regulator [Comamonadaceae bacterium]